MVLNVGKRLAHLLHERYGVRRLHLLWQISDRYILWHRDMSRRGLLQPCYYLKHGRFTCAVFPDKGYLVLAVDDVRYVVEERAGAEFNAEILNGYHKPGRLYAGGTVWVVSVFAGDGSEEGYLAEKFRAVEVGSGSVDRRPRQEVGNSREIRALVEVAVKCHRLSGCILYADQ